MINSPASPYAIFRAEDCNSATCSPIGLGQCLRIKPQKYYPKRTIRRKREAEISTKIGTIDHVQLAFA